MKRPRRCWRLKLSPLGRICQVSLPEIRQFLLDNFQQWGLPKAIRTDNGEPFGVPSRDVVPILSLWLLAWGIQPILNRPRRPQDNPNVERNQGVAGAWAEVARCPDVQTLQGRLYEAADIQRNHFRVRKIGHQPRTTVFKDLLLVKRPWVSTDFDEHKAYAHLAKVVYPRKVSSTGAIQLYNKAFQAGYAYRGQVVWVTFDPNNVAWLVLNAEKTIIRVIPDKRFSRDNLFNLTVCQ